MQITRRLEFDAGHRIPFHDSLCKNVHGHRYRLEVTVEGEIQPARGDSNDGMVLDFGRVKEIMNDLVVSQWDHSFLVWDQDSKMLQSLRILGSHHRTIILPCVPTAENLATLIFERLETKIDEVFENDLKLFRVRLYETPNCFADAYMGEG